MSLGSRFTVVALIFAVLAAPGFAGQFSFAGSFNHDNDVQFFSFTLLSASTVTLQTLGYGGSADNPGGTNANGQAISPGGFESVLQVYEQLSGLAIGGSMQPGPNPTCAPRTPDPNRLNFCQDVYAQVFLPVGSYFLSLTQSPNDPLGNLSDGFFYVDSDPQPDFNNGFAGTLGLQGNGNWAVDILGVDAASGQVPEPSSGVLAAVVALLARIGARKVRRRTGPQT